MSAYQPIDTIPLGEWVEVVTCKDRVRIARARTVTAGTRWIKRADRYGPRRVLCVTQERGDVWARAWRPVHMKETSK